jgi:hypothetical protein
LLLAAGGERDDVGASIPVQTRPVDETFLVEAGGGTE